MTILDQLADHARGRVAAARRAVPLEELRRQACSLPRGDFAFERAMGREGLSFICECKRASPSKGLIAPEFPYLQIAREYEAAGADGISVLTEPKWFLGSDRYLEEIVRAMERGDVALEESLKLFQEGTELVRSCNKLLDEAQLQVKKIMTAPDGSPVEEEFDHEL